MMVGVASNSNAIEIEEDAEATMADSQATLAMAGDLGDFTIDEQHNGVEGGEVLHQGGDKEPRRAFCIDMVTMRRDIAQRWSLRWRSSPTWRRCSQAWRPS